MGKETYTFIFREYFLRFFPRRHIAPDDSFHSLDVFLEFRRQVASRWCYIGNNQIRKQLFRQFGIERKCHCYFSSPVRSHEWYSELIYQDGPTWSVQEGIYWRTNAVHRNEARPQPCARMSSTQRAVTSLDCEGPVLDIR